MVVKHSGLAIDVIDEKLDVLHLLKHVIHVNLGLELGVEIVLDLRWKKSEVDRHMQHHWMAGEECLRLQWHVSVNQRGGKSGGDGL